MIHKQSERDTYGQHFRARFGTQRGSSPVPSGQWPNWRSFAPLAPICLGRQKWSTRCCTVRIDIIVRHMISYCYIARIYPTRSLICASFYLRYVPGLPNERYLVRSLDWSLPRPAQTWPGVDWSGVEWSGVGWIVRVPYGYGYGLNDCKTFLSFVAARLGYWYNYEV